MKCHRVTLYLLVLTINACASTAPNHFKTPQQSLTQAFNTFRETVQAQTSPTEQWLDVEQLLSVNLLAQLNNQRHQGATNEDINASFKIPTDISISTMDSSVKGLRGCLLINGTHPSLDKVSTLISFQQIQHRWLISHVNVVLRNHNETYIPEPDCDKFLPTWD